MRGNGSIKVNTGDAELIETRCVQKNTGYEIAIARAEKPEYQTEQVNSTGSRPSHLH